MSFPKWLLPASPSLERVLVISCLSRKFSKEFILAPFKLLPLCWVSEYVRFWKHLLRAVSVSYSLPAFLYANFTGFQSQTFEDLSSWCGTPRLESLMWGLDPNSLGRISAIMTVLLFVGNLRVMYFDGTTFLLLSILDYSFFISLVLENILC